MALSVATNTSAATAHRYLKTNDMEASRSLAKLSSGSRIVRASDDAASLAVGTKLKADVNALRQAQVNASHGSSVLQVADGAMQQVSDILIRMKAIATQAVTGSISDTERGYINSEFTELASQLDDLSTQTKFNGDALLDGTFNVDFAVGTDTTADVINVAITQERQLDRVGAERQHGRYDRERADRGCRRRRGDRSAALVPVDHGRADVAVRLRQRQPRHLGREHRRGALDAAGRRRGGRDGELLVQAGGDAGERRHARPGQPDAAEPA